MNISICTVLYHSADVLDSYFASLKNCITDTDEVLFYDNAPESEDELRVRELAHHYGVNIRYWSGTTNVGFAKACNKLALESLGSRLIFLNPDTQTISFKRERHESSQVLGATVLNPNGDMEGTFGRSRSVWDEIKLRWLRIAAPCPIGVGYVSGAALSVDRDAFLSVGGFDEKFFMYFEDIDLCFRLNDAGLSVSVDDNWLLTHIGGSAAKKVKTISALRSLDSSIYFHTKWGNAVVVYRVFSLLDAVLRVIVWGVKRDADSRRAYQSLVRSVIHGWTTRKQASN